MSERPAVPPVSGAIYGIGTDIIQIERVEGVMQRTHGRFAEKVLGPDELRIYQARKARSERRGLAFLATRFAAKEAVSKAIGLGMHWPMTWRAVQTLNLPSGQPVLRYSGELADWIALRGLHLQISVTDERDYAVAFAVAELQSKPSA
ncbi:holo-ACP synthase [Ralstonia pseudosolanacearum]|uniref:Holo-[acyl-carrier-protein] synthase n=1 Tax=Ralstonia solanacearum TaxID=305 RepID=A0AA92JT61_RALSL|nr:holo-ACP synthase [Ralstonia pseudosolanacearum]QOK92268.1 holo-ACP synthase [Ralstonia pseudosolanacearum]QOK97200.1 holo-ACP synthase [Ralstonia pseudosolanacearum]UWD92287.1 holo-ACP synthase [Ralstonia pseudosolanacearum]CAH0439294.1 Holo-[acyl-carrier-protein] synthase [Ralstonia pseudosolanacearum]